MNMQHVTDALQHFLAKHNIKARGSIGLVLVVPDDRAAFEIETAMKRDTQGSEALTMISMGERHVLFPRADAVINGVPIAVRVPKQTIEV